MVFVRTDSPLPGGAGAAQMGGFVLAAGGGCGPNTLPATTVPSLHLPEVEMGNHPSAFLSS